jgi:hypothetical protein
VIMCFYIDFKRLVSKDYETYDQKNISSFHVNNLMGKDSKIEFGFFSNTLIISKEI